MKKTIFICICSIILLSTTAQALRFGTAPIVKVEIKTLTKFLSSHNEALDKALKVHNLMTELPAIQTMAEQQHKMKAEAKKMQRFFDNLLTCNEQQKI